MFAHERRTIDDLASELSLTQRTVRRRLRELAEAGLVEQSEVDGYEWWRATRALSSKGSLLSQELLGDIEWLLERLPHGGERDRVLRALRRAGTTSAEAADGIVAPALDETTVRTLDQLARSLRERRALNVAVRSDVLAQESILVSVWNIDLNTPARITVWDHRAAIERVFALRDLKSASGASAVRFVAPSRAAVRTDAVDFELSDAGALDGLSVEVSVERAGERVLCRASPRDIEHVARFVLQHAPRARTKHPAVVAAIRGIVEGAIAPTDHE